MVWRWINKAKNIILLLLIFALSTFNYLSIAEEIQSAKAGRIEDAFLLLRSRRDNEALVIFEEIIAAQPDNQDAAWGKAEFLRRSRSYKEAQEQLNEILKLNPGHIPSLISMASIRYKDGRLKEALGLVRRVLKNRALDRQDEALAYLMLGSINSSRSGQGGFFHKLTYGTQIKGYFLKARQLAPDLPEVHLGLGTFYLLAPSIAGGSLDDALNELELTIRLAPGFATANARLAQAYKKKGDLEGYSFYLAKAKELDPENEVLKEITESSK